MKEEDKLIKEIEYNIYLLSEEIKQDKKKIKALTQRKQMLEGYKNLETKKKVKKWK